MDKTIYDRPSNQDLMLRPSSEQKKKILRKKKRNKKKNQHGIIT